MSKNKFNYESPEAEIVVKDFDEIRMTSEFDWFSSGFSFDLIPDENTGDDFFN